MKTLLFTFALSLALCAAHGATAQTKSMPSAQKADTVMVSQTTDGDYLVRRYVVRSGSDTDYSLHYKIGNSKLISTFDGNSESMAAIDSFMAWVDKDSLMRIQSVAITGYASPDGPLSLNQKLATARAQSLADYVNHKYIISKMYAVMTHSIASNWGAARAAIETSAIPNKQAVLKVIDENLKPAATERRLKAIPQAWSYLKANILPSMRYSEIEITYVKGSLLERRTMIQRPTVAPKPDPCCDPCQCVDVYESVSGIVVEMDDVGIDFEKKRR